jgi:hypothetical protein
VVFPRWSSCRAKERSRGALRRHRRRGAREARQRSFVDRRIGKKNRSCVISFTGPT